MSTAWFPHTEVARGSTAHAPVDAHRRRAIRQAIEVLQRAEPARWVPLPSITMPETTALVCVYRARNAAVVGEMIRTLPPQTEVRLWALDTIVPELAPMTIGSGPGGRTTLVNALVADLPSEPEMLAIVDDDIRFVIGGLTRLIHAGATVGFDLFQPAHSRTSHTAFGFVRKRPLTFARQTTFVEQGPAVVLSRRAQRKLLPLPEELVMGWGVEVRWHREVQSSGMRQGIIDAVAIRHGDEDSRFHHHTYDTAPELARMREELAAIGSTDLTDIQHTTRTIGIFGTRGRHED